MDERLLTVREAALLIGVAQATLRKWTEAGLLEATRTSGGHRRYSRAAIDGFIERGLDHDGQSAPARSLSYGAFRPVQRLVALPLLLLGALEPALASAVTAFA